MIDPARRSETEAETETETEAGALDEAAWSALTALCEAAYPDEACGWIADAVRAARRGGPDAFAFSDDDLLALAAASRTATPPRLLFHSHPDGDAALSATDLDALAPGGVVLHPLPHLVIAVAGGRAHRAALHAWRGATPRLVARFRRAPDGDGWTRA